MDKDLLWIGVAFMVFGVAGVYLYFSGIAQTFKEGLQGPSAYMAGIGIIFFAAGLMKDGLPELGPRGKMLIGIAIVFAVASLISYLLLA